MDIEIGDLIIYRLAGRVFSAPVKNVYENGFIKILIDTGESTLWIDADQIII